MKWSDVKWVKWVTWYEWWGESDSDLLYVVWILSAFIWEAYFDFVWVSMHLVGHRCVCVFNSIELNSVFMRQSDFFLFSSARSQCFGLVYVRIHQSAPVCCPFLSSCLVPLYDISFCPVLFRSSMCMMILDPNTLSARVILYYLSCFLYIVSVLSKSHCCTYSTVGWVWSEVN